jgi:XRE family transcriptional regulator, regulator of sulfur utilization
MSYRKAVGGNIKRIRKTRGWTQEKMAVRAGLSYEYVNRLENGRVNVSVDTLEKIARCLKIQIVELFEEN